MFIMIIFSHVASLFSSQFQINYRQARLYTNQSHRGCSKSMAVFQMAAHRVMDGPERGRKIHLERGREGGGGGLYTNVKQIQIARQNVPSR